MESIYDKEGVTRKNKGSLGSQILRNMNDPNHLVVRTEWENLGSAKNFIESEDLANTMQKVCRW